MTGKPVRHLSLTETLVLAAVLVGGIFGSALDRSLVATPAWRHLGVVAWADYSRTPIWQRRHRLPGLRNPVVGIGDRGRHRLLAGCCRTANSRASDLSGPGIGAGCDRVDDHRRPGHAARGHRPR